jgi:hypothetical protein
VIAMNLKQQFLNYAAGFAQSAGRRIAEFDQKLAQLEQEKTKIETQRDMARGAFQRLSNYPVVNGTN